MTINSGKAFSRGNMGMTKQTLAREYEMGTEEGVGEEGWGEEEWEKDEGGGEEGGGKRRGER